MTGADVVEVLRDITLDRSTWPETADSAAFSAVIYDSRRATPGSLFVALKGIKADGSLFARGAVDRGATAVVAESAPPPELRAPWLVTTDARLSLARLADRFYASPSRRMPVVGVTGTNGKTTTSHLLAAILDAAGLSAGLLGTVTYRVGREDREASRTTPEAPDVQRLLAEMITRGCRSAVMEVSSHALALRRVEGMRFAAAVFTNLTRDHLDFHVDMDSYFGAKRRLFEMLPSGAPAIINADDPRAPSLVHLSSRPITYGLSKAADVSPFDLRVSLTGLSMQARTPRGTVDVRSSLVGRPNASNILAAIAAALALEIPLDAIAQGIAALPGVPGRFEVVSSPEDDVTVILDYAHTDDALRNLLETARPLAPRQVITVFGCGGDRDRSKRPLMGMVAARLSDVVVVTSDNPRSEDPQRIIDEIMRGIPAGMQPATRHPQVQAIADRSRAIERAVELASAGDLVLVAGKGHEKYQQIGDRVLPFDDGEVARGALARRRRRPSKAG